MNKIFSGKKALVIGGTGGIGKAVTLGLAERGAKVIVHGGTSTERLNETLQEIKKNGGDGDGFLLFIDSPAAAQEIFTRCGEPDILVCAWGPFKQGNLQGQSPDFWQKITENNLIFPGILVSLCLTRMIEQNWGKILLFGGTNTDTIRGFITSTAYSAAKTALGVIAKSVAKSAGSSGVSCNVLCPGLTDTEYTTRELRHYNREKSPGGRPLSAEEIALAALSILENPCINGAVVTADQGLVL